ncbi:MAG: hypothetical protein A2Z20_01520 [Bdellovibrionales bacterium RBG_16_40_8]|nr:MAG: hypothetical protein A2Z20_01520 [Bdellovibrionales bacterium RBG_16_40_8]
MAPPTGIKVINTYKVWLIISLVAFIAYILSVYVMCQEARTEAIRLATVQLETSVRSNILDIERGDYRALGESAGSDLSRIRYEIHVQNAVFVFGDARFATACAKSAINLANKEYNIRWCRQVIFPYKTILFFTGLFLALVIFALSSILFFEKSAIRRFSALLEGVGVVLPKNSGLQDIISNIEDLQSQLLKAQKKEIELAKQAVVGQIARQVAHDIRSPLGALQLAFADTKWISEDRKKLAYSAINRVQQIADDLINKSKPTSNELIEISSAIDELVTEKKSLLSVHHKISLDSKVRPLMAKVSKTELQRILSNLINNSIEAMPSGGSVTISTREYKDVIEIIVSDTGSGISPEI